MNDPMKLENKLLAEIAGAERELSAAVAVGHKFDSDARDELARLEKELPSAMLDFVRGGVGTRRLEIRSRIRELKSDIEELPYLDQGLTGMRARIQALRNQERAARSRRTTYETMKERFENDPQLAGMSIRSDLLDQANALDCEQDAASFLESLAPGAA